MRIHPDEPVAAIRQTNELKTPETEGQLIASAEASKEQHMVYGRSTMRPRGAGDAYDDQRR
jgi:hypothetical protein